MSSQARTRKLFLAMTLAVAAVSFGSTPAQAADTATVSILHAIPDAPVDVYANGDLLLEEVSEHHYRIDRLMFHLTASPNVRSVGRIRLGRVGDIPPNDPDFGSEEVAIVADWCGRAGIVFGGRADIGHDAANRVVPFGSSTVERNTGRSRRAYTATASTSATPASPSSFVLAPVVEVITNTS